jgi:uncharacterized protein (DUF1800 family)
MARIEAQKAAAVGFSRFGLGARPGDLASIGNDIRGALLQEVVLRSVVIPAGENILPGAEAFHRLRVEQEKVRALRLASKAAPKDEPEITGAAKEAMQGMSDDAPSKGNRDAPAQQLRREAVRKIFQAETVGRLQAAKDAKIGFAERLVLFWSNHFCVSARKAGVVRVMAGAYEREAIRPHVFGRFSEMLLAAEKHPAMLVYLDNQQSIGPNSRGGLRQQKGLNENLAREILELHTLGVDGGYSQEDVTSLAKILTGWRFAREDNALASEGHFVFNPNLHEPGDQKLLGVVYREHSGNQGEKALLALAAHPSTARHVAKKLGTHFVSDTPNPALVARLEKTFIDTGGDLAEVSKTLIKAPEAWQEEPSKLRMPYEFLAASVRATNVEMKASQINGALMSMGQPLWSPPGPNGFSDQTSVWASPEGMKARLDFSARFAQFVPGEAKPTDALDEIMGPLVSEDTRTAVARASSREQGYALLLMSPEFQRR